MISNKKTEDINNFSCSEAEEEAHTKADEMSCVVSKPIDITVSIFLSGPNSIHL